MTVKRVSVRAMAALAAAVTFLSAARAAENGPLVCDKPHVSIGETHIRQQKHTFLLRNVSNEPVKVTATHKACGCVKREFSKYSLKPGETSEVTLDFPIRTKHGTIGDFVERLEIYVNDRHEAPAMVVSVSGRFIPIAYTLREGIYIEAPTGGETRFNGMIELFLNKARGVKIESIETSGELPIEATVVRKEDAFNEGEEKVVLEVHGTLHGEVELPAAAAVVVKLNSEDIPVIRIPVSLYKKRGHTVRFSPQLIAFGVLPSGAIAKRAVVVELPKSETYKVESAKASGDGVSVVIEELSKASHVIRLACQLDASSLTGAVKQELAITVTASDGQSEVYKLPISGYVKPAEPPESE